MEDEENDNIRSISHPDFNIYWNNISENVFESRNPLNTVQSSIDWCLSIGMTEDKDLAHTVGG
jgi:hypothetical protein